MLEDLSVTFDFDPPPERPDVIVADAFQARLRELAEQDASVALVLDALVGRDVPAGIWRRVLAAAADCPAALATQIVDALAAPELLDNVNTETHVARALAAGYEHLGVDERARIERAIVALPEHSDADRPNGEARRDELLSCLPEQLIATGDARRLRPATGTPSGWLMDESDRASWVTEDRVTAAATTAVAPDARAELEALVAPVRELTAAPQGAPQPAAWEQAAEDMKALRERLGRLQAHDHVRDSAFGALTYASVRAAARGPLPDDRASALAAEVLPGGCRALATSRRSARRELRSFAELGHPAPRVDAARGLCLLARVPALLPAEAVDAVRQLAGDRASVVRMHVAQAAHFLRGDERHALWSIIEQLAEDRSAAVLHALLGSLGALPCATTTAMSPRSRT